MMKEKSVELLVDFNNSMFKKCLNCTFQAMNLRIEATTCKQKNLAVFLQGFLYVQLQINFPSPTGV